MEENTVAFDRRQIYRPFLERLNPASPGVIEEQGLIVPWEHDPRDPEQPPIHVAFANAAELSRGAQMALVGGIGSGKTTELQLTLKLLKRHADAINIYVDLAELTDLSDLNPGAILIAIGLELYRRLKKPDKETPEITIAYAKLKELASGKTNWVEPDAYGEDEPPDDEPEPESVPVRVPGLLKPRFAARQRAVAEVQHLVFEIAMPLLEADAQITVLIDGLDRLIRPDRFREFAEQDLRALRESKISIIVATPLLLWFDKSRFLQDYFDDVKHIPAAISDPEKSDFLNQILRRRGAAELMEDREIAEVSRFSGGVLRDLITLARTSAEAAYRDDKDRIGPEHTLSAIRQMGKRYLVGLGKVQERLIRRLIDNEEFSVEAFMAKQLLINRQVLEYFSGQRDFFAVHPALAKMLSGSA
jgi:ABC-type dipeptide/oligopeptide/nickel transport system ATPase component